MESTIKTLRRSGTSWRSVVLAVAILWCWGCGAATGPTATGVPAALEVVSGDSQSDTVGHELPAPLVVRVVDADSNPVSGQIVNFRVISGGGSVFAGVALTDSAGEARERWTLGTVAADTQIVEARAIDPATGDPLVFGRFTAVGVADVPDSMLAVGDTLREGSAGVLVADSLRVRLLDRYGNGVPNDTIRWSITGGGAIPDSSITNSRGLAVAGWALGTRLDSVQVATATFAPLGASIVFAGRAELPADAVLSALRGNAQTDTIGAALSDTLVASIHLADGRPVVGLSVTWVERAGRGAVSPLLSRSDSLGSVRALWTVGEMAGTDSVEALADSTHVALFTADVTPGNPVSVIPVRGNRQTAPASTTLPDSVAARVLDRAGNRVPGVGVTWAVVAGGGSIAPASDVTNAAGEVEAEWTLGSSAGQQSAVAVVVGLVAAEFTATAGATSTPASAIAAGDFHTCAIYTGSAYCWGLNDPGQLGTGNRVGSSVPVQVVGGLSFASLDLGGRFSCGMTTTGNGYCWGRNNYGQLGTGYVAAGFVDGDSVPVASASSLVLNSLSAGNWPTCAVTTSAEGYCWGWGAEGERGDGTLGIESQPDPTLVLGGISWQMIRPGAYHTCGLATSGKAYCWGLNGAGQLGTDAANQDCGGVPCASQPLPVNTNLSFEDIVAAGVLRNIEHSCGLVADGTAYCWGYNGSGQLGDGTNASRTTPTRVSGGIAFVSITAYGEFTCGLDGAGRAYCWGDNEFGQLGDGTLTSSNTPIPVAGGHVFAQLATGWKHACGVTTGGEVFCWGRNEYGQLGDGTTTDSSVPVRVVAP